MDRVTVSGTPSWPVKRPVSICGSENARPTGTNQQCEASRGRPITALYSVHRISSISASPWLHKAATPSFFEQQPAFGGNAMQSAGVFANDMSAFYTLIQAEAVTGDFRSRNGRPVQSVYRRAGQNLPPLVHTAIGQTAIVNRYIPAP